MLDAVAAAIERDRRRREGKRRTSEARALFETSSPRERQVMTLVTSGLMNMQVAGETSLSEPTVKVHRWQAMRKMQARTLADLVRMADVLGPHRNGS